MTGIPGNGFHEGSSMTTRTLATQDIQINAPHGTALNIKVEGIDLPVRITSHLVGMVKDEYLLMTHPTPFATIKPKLFPGNNLILQYLHEGTVFVFGVKIREVMNSPIRVVLLDYPDKMVSRRLRSEQRTLCRFPAGVFFKGASRNATVEDINAKGCRIVSTYQPAEKVYIARVGDVLKISFQLPVQKEGCTLTGTVRNVAKNNLTVSYGVQFDPLTPEVAAAIKSYVEGNYCLIP